MIKNKWNKYSYYCEGECDEKLLHSVKVTLLKSKIPLCKACCKKANGTPRLNEIPKVKKCCKRIVIFDKDNLSNEQINKFKKDLLDKDVMLIISSPSIECVLYSIFDVPDAELGKKILESKLEISLNKFLIEYNHKPDNINRIIEWVSRNENIKQEWLKNLKKLKDKNRSNFIDIIDFFNSYDF